MSTLAHALTTLTRVKNRLSISDTTWDSVLERLINAATEYLEGECARRFKETTYTNEVYSGGEGDESFIFLRQRPVTALSAAQYRAGTPDSPSWTSFAAGDYELITERIPCRVRIYGDTLAGTNNLRFTYTAGYKIDFTNDTSATHTLPAEISDLCERLVVWLFKKRESEGKASEAGQEASVSWREGLAVDDKQIIARHRMTVFF